MTILFTVLALLIFMFLIWLLLKKKKNKPQKQQSQQQKQPQPPTPSNNNGEEKQTEKGEINPQPQQVHPNTPKPVSTTKSAPKKGIPVRLSGIASGDGGNKKYSADTIPSSGEVKRNFIRPRDLK